jgi:hypothetical protein
MSIFIIAGSWIAKQNVDDTTDLPFALLAISTLQIDEDTLEK